MSFSRPHHQQVARVLESLDADVLRACSCWFGGGTAIALRFGEFRESLDIDFVVSDASGFRELRRKLRGAHDLAALTRPGVAALATTRELRADQYGIRGFVDVGRRPIKFEIVSEGRIVLETPGRGDSVCGLATLRTVDLAATKLLANVDRWRDDSVFSRDAIDLAFMPLPPRVFAPAVDKAGEAYGREDIAVTLKRALQALRERSGHLRRCMAALSIDEPAAAMVQRLRLLERRLEAAAGASATIRPA